MIRLEIVNDAVAYLTTLLQNTGILLGVFLVVLESIIPALPLGVFIALNINAFGLIIGIIISWLSTCFGCYLAFSFYKFLSKNILKNILASKKLEKVIKKMKTIEFSNLVVLIALPFTPAFLINIACGVINMSKRKFITAILIGKIFMVIFWGCIGKSLLESITDIKTIMIVSVFIVIAYIISKIVSKKMKIE